MKLQRNVSSQSTECLDIRLDVVLLTVTTVLRGLTGRGNVAYDCFCVNNRRVAIRTNIYIYIYRCTYIYVAFSLSAHLLFHFLCASLSVKSFLISNKK